MQKLNGKVVCLVLHDRHIYVGRLQIEDRGMVRLYNAFNVRYWDGPAGLGRLLQTTGPTNKDTLDPCGSVWCAFPGPQAHLLECAQDKWSELINEDDSSTT